MAGTGRRLLSPQHHFQDNRTHGERARCCWAGRAQGCRLHTPKPPRGGCPAWEPASQGSTGGKAGRRLCRLGDFPEEEGLPSPSLNCQVPRGIRRGRKCVWRPVSLMTGLQPTPNTPARLHTPAQCSRLRLPPPPDRSVSMPGLCLHSCCFWSKEGLFLHPSKPNAKASLSRSFSRSFPQSGSGSHGSPPHLGPGPSAWPLSIPLPGTDSSLEAGTCLATALPWADLWGWGGHGSQCSVFVISPAPTACGHWRNRCEQDRQGPCLQGAPAQGRPNCKQRGVPASWW